MLNNFLLMVYNYPSGLFSTKEKAIAAGMSRGPNGFVVWKCDVDKRDTNGHDWYTELSVDNNWEGWKKCGIKETAE